MVCHEVWEYEDARGVATLAAFALLCPDCSGVHHIGRTALRGFQREAVAHMVGVNQSGARTAEVQISEAFAEWSRRSVQPWTVTVASELRTRYAELAALEGLVGLPDEGRERVRERGRRRSRRPSPP